MELKWLLIDMHMHSQYSKINKSGDADKVKEMSAKEFVDIMIENGIEVFSITDHNYFAKNYYDEIDKYISDNNLSVKLINGVEFDAYVNLDNGDNDFIHICIYFDDNVDRAKLSSLIQELYRDEDNNLLTPSFIEILNKLHELKTKYIVIPHGNKDRGLLKDHLIDHLSPEASSDYYKYAMYKIFNGFDVSPGFYGVSEEFWASSFLIKLKSLKSLLILKRRKKLKVLKINYPVNFETMILNCQMKNKNYLIM